MPRRMPPTFASSEQRSPLPRTQRREAAWRARRCRRCRRCSSHGARRSSVGWPSARLGSVTVTQSASRADSSVRTTSRERSPPGGIPVATTSAAWPGARVGASTSPSTTPSSAFSTCAGSRYPRTVSTWTPRSVSRRTSATPSTVMPASLAARTIPPTAPRATIWLSNPAMRCTEVIVTFARESGRNRAPSRLRRIHGRSGSISSKIGDLEHRSLWPTTRNSWNDAAVAVDARGHGDEPWRLSWSCWRPVRLRG